MSPTPNADWLVFGLVLTGDDIIITAKFIF
jgi:hypothetical protein